MITQNGSRNNRTERRIIESIWVLSKKYYELKMVQRRLKDIVMVSIRYSVIGEKRMSEL